MAEFYTADLHLEHRNIIKYCGRTLFMTEKDLIKYNELKNASRKKQKQFKISDESLANMKRELIRRWNEKVKPGDTVYHIGDEYFKNLKNELNGKIIFIRGNHISVKTKIHSLVINIGGRYINLIHDPIFANVNFEINFTAHVHRKWRIKRIRKGESFTDCINVGVDVWDYYPVTYNEIMKRYHQWKKKVRQ